MVLASFFKDGAQVFSRRSGLFDPILFLVGTFGLGYTTRIVAHAALRVVGEGFEASKVTQLSETRYDLWRQKGMLFFTQIGRRLRVVIELLETYRSILDNQSAVHEAHGIPSFRVEI